VTKVEICSPLTGQPKPTHTIIGDKSGNYEQISTNFSPINLLSKMMSISFKTVEYVPPSWGNPPPHSHIGDITGNYERIFTKLSVICLLG